ncbi:metalloregulator ArsR/SmtB family transcription factor [Neptuniibacter sp. CAU 1671]|uniref:ArsR/SmtB family transcription factor n=1 Tax=Neptuniibacter sp. CAU 1671 TaxID=3032593 RepID=UPI0023DBD2A4|nr:metalloregulator ArsR/SmtB family transcription factor [Neptuniibacter sp. CAU 1671]MDF2183155.1 metalloregulator ArsR/SmtB family transcription factor [Neptuniibacter sp. CAU 1671]
MTEFNTDIFKALSDETRLKIMLLLQNGDPMCVCDLTDRLELSQPKISRHLALLRGANLLQDERKGQWVYYCLHPDLPDWVHQVLDATALGHQDWLAQQRLQPVNSNCC